MKLCYLFAVCLFSASFSGNYNNNILLLRNEKSLSTKPSFKNEILNKFSDYVDAHNSYSDEKIMTNKVDFIKDIYSSSGKQLYFVDLFEDNGSMIVDDAWNVFSLKVNGEYIDIQEYDGKIIFDESDGVLYKEEDGGSFSYSSKVKDEIIGFSSPVINNGTDDSKGYIYDVDAYISEAHPDYDYENAFYFIKKYEKSSQRDTSVLYNYVYDDDNLVTSTKSEGNCVINAVYSCMLNAGKQGWNKNAIDLGLYTFTDANINADRIYSTCDPYNHTVYDHRTPKHYTIGINKYDWGLKEEYYKYGSFSIPKLYWHARERAIDFGYACVKLDTIFKNSVADLIRHAYSMAGYSYPTVNNDGDACDNIILNIKNNNIPGVICAGASPVYGDHAMSVYGYKTYSVTKHILWFTEKNYKYMFLVDDGYCYSSLCQVSDKSIKAGNLSQNNSYTLDDKLSVRWYDPTCTSFHQYFSLDSNTLIYT